MLPYTLDNNLIYGYSGSIFNPKNKSSTNSLECYYARATREPEIFKEECIITAKILGQEAARLNRIPMIFLSGGLDSEVVVKAFIEAGVDFQPVTFKFKDNLNQHEIHYVEKFCKRHGIKSRYLEIDIVHWLDTTEAKDMYVDSCCTYSQMLPHMKLMNIVWNDWQGLPVMGNGDFYVSRDINPVWRMKDKTANQYVWNYVEYEYILAWFRYAVSQHILGGIGFFQHTPEITLSMALDSRIQKVCNNSNPYKMSSRSTKYVVYKDHWPDLEIRPKWNGGELVANLYYCKAREFSKSLNLSYVDKWSMEYNEFVNLLKPL
jgi:hypothetical protein